MVMRLVIDTLIAVMLVSLLAAVLLYHRAQRRLETRHQQVHEALALLHERALYQGTIEDDRSSTGFPLEISPSWFQLDGLPMNNAVPGRNPWMDVAPENDSNDHPPDPIITSPTQAGIWYNPNRGIFRARVMPQKTHEQTIRLYNLLNGTGVTVLANATVNTRRAVVHSLYDPAVTVDEHRLTEKATNPREKSLLPGLERPQQLGKFERPSDDATSKVDTGPLWGTTPE